MKLYGSGLTDLGTAIIISAAVLGIIFTAVHILLSARLKKILEKEYGSEKLGGEKK